MPDSCTHVYVHFVWATWNRAPRITPEIEPRLYACIGRKVQENRCELKEIGGTGDHVHCLVRLHATVSVAWLAKEMKGASSHLVTHEVPGGESFKWQGTYGAFSVSPHEVETLRAYIRRQKDHHARGETRAEWERCMEEGG